MAETDGFNRLKEWLVGTIANPGLITLRELSIEQFAREIGKTRAALYFYLNDTHRPTPETLNDICNYLGVSYEEGLKWVEPRAAHPPIKNPKTLARKRRRQLV